jgi:hypothetical protein
MKVQETSNKNREKEFTTIYDKEFKKVGTVIDLNMCVDS